MNLSEFRLQRHSSLIDEVGSSMVAELQICMHL